MEQESYTAIVAITDTTNLLRSGKISEKEFADAIDNFLIGYYGKGNHTLALQRIAELLKSKGRKPNFFVEPRT